jgi:hypothetical protein
MMRHRYFFYPAALWEILRFTALYALLLRGMGASSPPLAGIVALWFGAGSLATAAAFFFIAYNPQRYGIYALISAVAKGLGLVIGTVLLVFTAAGYDLFGPLTAFFPYSSIIIPGLILFLDLIFLLFLLSFILSAPLESAGAGRDNTTELPEYSVTDIEEE